MDAYLGQIALFSFDRSPAKWVKCDGALQKIRENEALFSLLGIRFGGDGMTFFAVPNLPPVKDVNGTEIAYYYICIDGAYPMHS